MTRKKILPDPNEPLTLRILISYWYYKDVDVGALVEDLKKRAGVDTLDVFADSGAFTAQSSGVHIDLKEYTDWIHKWEEYLTCYLNLDVIGDQEGTNRNQKRLEEYFGVHPVPVFTFQRNGSDYQTLQHQLDRYEYISLGGMVPFMGRPKQVLPHLIKCFKMAGDRAVFHGLGCTNWTLLKALPFYSVDSSSWVGGVRYGNMSIFDDRTGRWRRTKLSNPDTFEGLASLFTRYGYSVKEFMYRHSQQYHDIAALQGLSYMAAERWLRKRHGLQFLPSVEQGIIKDQVALDPRHPKTLDQEGIPYQIDPDLAEYPGGLRSYLATVPWVDESVREIASSVNRINQSQSKGQENGLRLYLANTAKEFFEDAASQLGRLYDQAGLKIYLADTGEIRLQASADGLRTHREGGSPMI